MCSNITIGHNKQYDRVVISEELRTMQTQWPSMSVVLAFQLMLVDYRLRDYKIPNVCIAFS